MKAFVGFQVILALWAAASQAGLPLCSELSDRFCRTLWAAPNFGNWDLAVGTIRKGASPKSSLDAVKRLDLDAWLEGFPRFSPNLQETLLPLFNRLKKHLEIENPGKKWQRELEAIETGIEDAIQDLAETRARGEARAFAKAVEIKDEIIRAKFENHPQWRRALRIFERVRADYLKEIPLFPVSARLKAFMRERVESIQPRLPLRDPRLAGAGASARCGSTEMNAYYTDNLHIVRICAGLIHAHQSEATLYTTFAHEIAHSFDPRREALHRFTQTPIGKIVQSLCDGGSRVLPKEEWETLSNTFTEFQAAGAPEESEYAKLTDCLSGGPPKNAYSSDRIRQEAGEYADFTVATLKNEQLFSLMAQPTFEKDGHTIANSYYLNPLRLKARQTDDLIMKDLRCDLNIVPELFLQNLQVVGYDPAAKNRKREFGYAIAKTQNMLQAIYEAWFSVCGAECKELKAAGIGRNNVEIVADWMAHRLFARYLSDIRNEHRLESTLIAEAEACRKPDELTGAEDLQWEESKSRDEEHSDYRLLRLRVFTPEVRELAQCSDSLELRASGSSCTL